MVMDIENVSDEYAEPTQDEPMVVFKKPSRKKRKGVGLFSLVHRSIIGLPIFDPAANLKRGRNRTVHTTLAMKRGIEHTIKLFCGITLGADDLDCLLAIIYIAGKKGVKIHVTKTESQRVDIVDGLDTKNVRQGDDGEDILEDPTDENLFLLSDHVRVEMKISELIYEMGITRTGNAYKISEERLERLSVVSYFDYGPVRANSRRSCLGAKQQLLFYRGSEADDELVIVVNARLSEAILGKHFTRIPLQDYLSLEKDTAKILFVRLCSWLRNPGENHIHLNKLLPWIYLEEAEEPSTQSMRKTRLRDALEQIGRLPGWTIVAVQDGLDPLSLIQRYVVEPETA